MGRSELVEINLRDFISRSGLRGATIDLKELVLYYIHFVSELEGLPTRDDIVDIITKLMGNSAKPGLFDAIRELHRQGVIGLEDIGNGKVELIITCNPEPNAA